jgi:hypothetical protein
MRGCGVGGDLCLYGGVGVTFGAQGRLLSLLESCASRSLWPLRPASLSERNKSKYTAEGQGKSSRSLH